jgi:hypothetical protein
MSNYLNLQSIDQEQALNLTKFFVRSNQNIFLFGQKGVGKTHIAIQAIKECGLKVNYINLSVIERTDLSGFPDMMRDSDIVYFKSPYYLPNLLENQKPDCVILFDEVDKASPEVTAPLLEILQFRTVNGKKINTNGCILTGNLISENVYSNKISTALLDRGAKYTLSFNFEKWIDWAKSNQIHDLILGFLKNNTEFIIGDLEDASYASPSPRSWSLASDSLLKAKDLKLNDSETISHIISGYVGHEAGLRFKIWYEYHRKFEPFIVSLIENGDLNLNFESLHITEKLIFIVSACYIAKQKTINNSSKSKNKFIYLENLCNFFIQNKIDKEMQIMGFYNSFDFEMITKYKLYSCKLFFDHFTKLNENVLIKK